MIYKDESIPENFNKVAEINNNFIVFVKENKLNSGVDYEAYYQFLSPSTYVLYVPKYRITKGDCYSYVPNYNNTGVYSYITDYDVNYSLNTYTLDDSFSSAEKDRADIVIIFGGQILCVICILWVFHQLSRLFFKGGLS